MNGRVSYKLIPIDKWIAIINWEMYHTSIKAYSWKMFYMTLAWVKYQKLQVLLLNITCSLFSHSLSTHINISVAWLRNISVFSAKTSSVERCTNRRSLSILQSIIEITSLDNLCENWAFSVSQLMDIVLMAIVLLRIMKRIVHVTLNNCIAVFKTYTKTRLKQ